MSVASTISSDGGTDHAALNEYKMYCIDLKFFAVVEDNPDFFRCQVQGCGKEYKHIANAGYTTMGKHVVDCHRIFLLELLSQKKRDRAVAVAPGQTTISSFYAYCSDEARNIADWIQLILFENFPLDSCDKKRHPVLAKYVTLSSMSRKTTSKYLMLLHEKVKLKVQKILPKRFVCMFDGWSLGTEHYLGLFVVFMDSKTATKKRVLLSCMVADDVDESTEYTADVNESLKYFGLTAEDLYDEVLDVLRDYGFSESQLDEIENTVQAFIGDNVYANRKLARIVKVPFVGCRSHLLNLAVNAGIGNPQRPLKKAGRGRRAADASDEEDDGIDLQLDDDDAVMIKRGVIIKADLLQASLSTVKNASVIRSAGIDLNPERMNKTRWSSVSSLVTRTISMYKKKNLSEIQFSSKSQRSISRRLLTETDMAHLVNLDKDLSKISVATQILQRDSLTLAQCQDIIDFVVQEVPDIVSVSDHLSWDYWKDDLDLDERNRKCHMSYYFNCGVIKIQKKQESLLSPKEREACKHLLRQVVIVDSQSDDDGDDETKEQLEKKKFARRLNEKVMSTLQAGTVSAYEDCRHIEGTSDPVERLFSFTKRVMSDHRKHMGPEVLNAICCLTVNREFWAEGELMAGHVIQEIMNEERAAKDRENRRQERERQQRQEADRRDAASASDDDM